MKIVNVYHSIDLDGWMSAAIVKHWWTLNNKDGKFYDNPYKGDCSIIAGKENENSLTMLGYNYGDEIPNLSKYDKVIMCDISFPKDVMDSLKSKLRSNFVWIDHHISAINEMQYTNNRDSSYCSGLRDTQFAACELTWKYFFPYEPMPEIVRLLGRYDCFGSKGTFEEKYVLEFQYGARQKISNYEEAYKSLYMGLAPRPQGYLDSILISGKSIYQYLCTEAKQTYKNGFKITLFGEDYITYQFICINKERFNPINFGIDYHKDGYDGCACFHYVNGMWNFSLYNDNGEVDCSAIAKQYGGGGHFSASGFRIKNITQIINE